MTVPPARRKLIGNIFLVMTLLVTVTALTQGGLWWAAVTVCAAITLWGIGAQGKHPNSP
ncbi:hypothetical protein [Rothia nasimurium]|uniref:hypothetical protein n=1 Tax=Rothia nasimurium TaxID=85336 RepID=UPI001F455156|nr:hypothetical protein [Rothia nasimurium]